MSKTTIITIAVAVVCLAGGFAGGTQYQKSKSAQNSGRMMFGNLGNLTPEQRDAMRQQLGGAGGFVAGGRNGIRAGGGAIAGEILSKDAKSVTVKLPDGGSKIIFYSESTQIGKMTQGKTQDLAVGENVFVTGTANSDGFFMAQMIQVRPSITP